MKTKIVTIEYWDGKKQRIRVPGDAAYIEVLPNSGAFYAHRKRPRMRPRNLFYAMGEFIYAYSLPGHAPKEDGHTKSILLRIQEV